MTSSLPRPVIRLWSLSPQHNDRTQGTTTVRQDSSELGYVRIVLRLAMNDYEEI